jgi:hypothetical protein
MMVANLSRKGLKKPDKKESKKIKTRKAVSKNKFKKK